MSDILAFFHLVCEDGVGRETDSEEWSLNILDHGRKR